MAQLTRVDSTITMHYGLHYATSGAANTVDILMTHRQY